MAMKRTQVDLTQNEHKALTALSRSTKKKRSEIIREAIDEHIKKNTLPKTGAKFSKRWQEYGRTTIST